MQKGGYQILEKYIESVMKDIVKEDYINKIKNISIMGIQRINNKKNKTENPLIDKCNVPDISDAKSCGDSEISNDNGENYIIECENKESENKYTYILKTSCEIDVLLKEFYLFVIYKIIQIDAEHIGSEGIYYDSQSENYFKNEKFEDLKNNNILLSMYASYYMKNHNLPDTDLITKLSAEEYEKGESNACISFCNDEEVLLYSFESLTEIDKEDNIRQIRKLMEITNGSDMALAVKNDNKITGLVDNKINKGYCIIFNGKLSWSLFYENKEIFSYRDGEYTLNISEKKNKYESELDKKESEDIRKKVYKIAEALKKQKHGTAAVIAESKFIESEVDRLCRKFEKGQQMEPFNFMELLNDENEDKIKHIIGFTNIDGAIFLDTHGYCYAIGVIVDGETIVEGEKGRGSRYNSINNYVKWAPCLYNEEDNCMFIGIIVSEDGMVNVVKSGNK